MAVLAQLAPTMLCAPSAMLTIRHARTASVGMGLSAVYAHHAQSPTVAVAATMATLVPIVCWGTASRVMAALIAWLATRQAAPTAPTTTWTATPAHRATTSTAQASLACPVQATFVYSALTSLRIAPSAQPATESLTLLPAMPVM